MERTDAKRLIEGILLVSDQPVPLKRLKDAVGSLEQAEVRAMLDELNQQYVQAQHALRIQELAGGFQLVTDPALAPALKRALELPKDDVFSKAALETLAIIAYRQPLTKAEIEAIRGVDVSGTLETLLERQFIRVVGRKETPGRPLLYGTTLEFLQHLGLKDLKDLPVLPAGANITQALIPQVAASSTQEPASRDPSAVAQPH